MTKSKKKGLLVLLSPIVGLLIIFVLFFITTAVVAGFDSARATAIGSIISVILSFLGILTVLSLVVCVPLGIYLLVKKEDQPKITEIK
ncbi:MAG: hypothetical protein A2Y67_04365 [Candidatus Buchananbacteria bacterium RBG_13_39_9]|uniref:MotA/TolQ/ExbB proton channel domain-containing protein n=1 Tax=Candidatus Buchananbacteria bacterium RBG_13_39_9 TaxID=1797531 RepID=A0A1G1XQF2_9BACT|nr:MAG: hypothetical protein A2Y67_04365 [Candidatus Buchananbacteria bacterium RBG_13_39_9]